MAAGAGRRGWLGLWLRRRLPAPPVRSLDRGLGRRRLRRRAQPLPAVHRPGGGLRPSLRPRGRRGARQAAPAAQPWLAGQPLRVLGRDPQARLPLAAWRPGRGRLRPRHPLAPGLRLLLQAAAAHWPEAHRAPVQHPDDRAARLRPLPRPGRRLGVAGDLLPRAAPRRARQGDPPQHDGAAPPGRTAKSRRDRLDDQGRRGDGRAGRLFPPAGLQAAVAGLAGRRQPGGAGGLDHRAVLRLVRPPGEAVRSGLHPRPADRQHHDLCDDRQLHDRRLVLSRHGRGDGGHAARREPACETPTAFANFPGEALYSAPPRSWADRAYNIVRWTEMPTGGHFAAMEEPDLFVDDVRAWAREH